MKFITYLLFFVAAASGCTKSQSSSSGWTDAQIDEVSGWHFSNVSSKSQTMATRGDNAKREFSKCWAIKISHEYSYAEYNKAWKELDEYVRTNHIVLTTLDESVALGQKYPLHQRMNDFVVECGNELKM